MLITLGALKGFNDYLLVVKKKRLSTLYFLFLSNLELNFKLSVKHFDSVFVICTL